ncbi:MAG TPA: hypothetical protein DCE65_03230 [Clostridiales bacterium]|nr:hypothetical protein [Clostridiales bacterium]
MPERRICLISERTIRYYTDRDLLPIKRDGGNRRIFDEVSVNRLMGIKCLKCRGMSIENIKRYGNLCRQGDGTLAERIEIMCKQFIFARKKQTKRNKFSTISQKRSYTTTT